MKASPVPPLSGRMANRLPDRFNVATWFVDRLVEEGRGDHVAILCQDQSLTYGEVLRQVNRTGNVLRRLGVEIENRVLMILPDCPQFAEVFFATIKIGAVPVPVNTLLTVRDYTYMLENTRAKVAVVHADLLDSVLPALKAASYLRDVVVVPASSSHQIEAASGGRLRMQPYETLIASESAELTPADTCKDDVAFWLYTSGTTGSPSAAVHLHHDMVVCAELFAGGILEIQPEDRTFSVAKLFFAYGLGNALYFPFSVGATTILHPGRPEPATVFEIVRRHRPTIFYGVPTSYAALLHETEQGANAEMSSVRIATSAGEPLPASIFRRWRDRFGVEILDGIGTTEVLHMFIANRRGEVRPGSSGKPVSGYEVRVLDDEDRPVKAGEIGNLLVAGDSTCAAYWNRHEVTKAAIQGEWIRTRDKYHFDEDGYYWYEGRSDDMLKVGGIWVSPTEVEQAVIEHPAVLECAVVGVSDADGLIRPKAVVVLKDPSKATDELAREIQAFVKDRLAPYKYPRIVEFAPELPKTATGKIQRYKLRQAP